MKPPPLTKIAIEQAKTLPEIVAMINQTFTLAHKARDIGDAALLRTVLEQRRRLERKAGQLLLAGPVPDGLRLSAYRGERYRALARKTDAEFERALARWLAERRGGANGNMVPSIRMHHSPWRRDEHGILTRTVQAADLPAQDNAKLTEFR